MDWRAPDRLRVLFVEDSPAFVTLVERLFSADGIAIERRCVETLTAFHAAVEQFDPHVILSDYVLPEADGLAFLEAARTACPLVPVIVVSGAIGDDLAVDVLKRGAADYVAKTRIATLVPRVQRALHEAVEQRVRVTLEAQVREREAFFHSLVEASPDGMMVVDPAGRIVLANTEMERMFGYAPGELAGAAIEVLMAPRFRLDHGRHLLEFIAAPARRAMRTGLEVPGMRKGGEEVQVSIALSPVETASGLQVLATVRDMTEAISLRSEVGHARAQLDTMPECLVLLDRDGRVTYVNEEWRRIARRGGAGDALVAGVGLNYLDACAVAHDATIGAIRDGLSDVLAGRSANFSAVYPSHGPDDLRWFRLEARPVDSEHGAALVTHVDHTEAHLAVSRLRVQDAIACGLAEDPSLPDICRRLIEAVVVELEWELGAVWVADPARATLRCRSLHTDPALAGGAFEALTRAARLARGEGLPGRAWASLGPEWTTDIAADTSDPRQATALAQGFRAVFAMPLLIESELLCVVEFHSTRPRHRDAALLSMLSSVGRQLGDLARRQCAESVREATLAELRRVRERLDTVLEAAPASILMVDRSGAVEFANRPLLHTPVDALVGGPWLDVFPPEQRALPAAALQRVFRSGASELFEAPLVGADKSARWFQNHLAPVRHGNDVVGAVVIAQDVSEKKEIEDELATAQRLAAVGSLAAGVAHEINTPIQFVGDSIHFLREALADTFRLVDQLRTVRRSVHAGAPSMDAADAARRLEEAIDLDYLRDNVPEACDRCVDGIDRVSTIVRAMKEFAHAPGRDMAPADLNRAIHSTLVVAGNEYKLVADLVTDFGEVPPVTCHVSDVNRVILNLVVNAAHAVEDVVKGSGRKGTISVRTRRDGDAVVVEVGDTGCGIPEAVRARMFEPFFTTKDVGRGSGQGLAIAWSVVADKHGGRIYCESEVGVGTTFYVRLPIAGRAPREAPRAVDAPSAA